MKKLFLHIGTEKTGTTSIQHFLHKNKKALFDNGYHLLECGGEKNHRAIPSCCMLDDDFDDFFLDRGIDSVEKKQQFRRKLHKSFNEEMKGLSDSVHSVIITSEHFHSRLKSTEAIERFKLLVAGYFSEIKVICYIREQSTLASSLYSTGVISGSNIAFSSFLEKCVPTNRYYNYHALLTRWSDVFSPEQLDVRIFSRNELYNDDLLDDFCVAINENLLMFTDKDLIKENESMSNTGVMIGRAINALFGRYDKDGLVNKSRKKAIKLVAKTFPGRTNNIASDEYKRIYEDFRVLNQEVARKYFKNRDDLFPWKPLSISEEGVDEGQVKALTDVIRDLKSVSRISDEHAVLFRDAAILLEGVDIKKAYELMKLAHAGRPEGPVIKRKIKEYEDRL